MQRPRPNGFTLVEMLVTLAVMALLGFVALPALHSFLGGDVDQAGNEVGAMLRTLYTEAAVRNTPMRLAYDVDRGRYWVEQASGKVRLFGSRGDVEEYIDDQERLAEDQEREAEQAERRAESLADAFNDMLGSMGIDPSMAPLLGLAPPSAAQLAAARPEPINDFAQIQEGQLRPRNLPSGTRFKAIWTPAWDRPVEWEEPSEDEEESRVLYTHIFPTGYMEDTVVWIEDGRGNELSLTVEPLTGRIRLGGGDVRIPDLRDRYED